jgi:hypothetical protein
MAGWKIITPLLNERFVFNVLLSPANKCSYLLWKSGVRIVYLDSQRNKLEISTDRAVPIEEAETPQIEKAPDKDETL